jgi:hypothetical protein
MLFIFSREQQDVTLALVISFCVIVLDKFFAAHGATSPRRFEIETGGFVQFGLLGRSFVACVSREARACGVAATVM